MKNQDKTTFLLRRSAKENIPIVCSTYIHSAYLKGMAKQLELSIPDPAEMAGFTVRKQTSDDDC